MGSQKPTAAEMDRGAVALVRAAATDRKQHPVARTLMALLGLSWLAARGAQVATAVEKATGPAPKDMGELARADAAESPPSTLQRTLPSGGGARVYVASSWRNAHQPAVVQRLREEGYDVYDFRNPPRRKGFSWKDAAWDGLPVNGTEHKWALRHPEAQAAFTCDMEGLAAADAVVLVLPSGRSAHLEAGWAAGAGRLLVVYQPEGMEPELMYGMAQDITRTLDQTVEHLGNLLAGRPRADTRDAQLRAARSLLWRMRQWNVDAAIKGRSELYPPDIRGDVERALEAFPEQELEAQLGEVGHG